MGFLYNHNLLFAICPRAVSNLPGCEGHLDFLAIDRYLMVICVWCLVFGVLYLVFSVLCWCLVSGISCLVFGNWCLVFGGWD